MLYLQTSILSSLIILLRGHFKSFSSRILCPLYWGWSHPHQRYTISACVDEIVDDAEELLNAIPRGKREKKLLVSWSKKKRSLKRNLGFGEKKTAKHSYVEKKSPTFVLEWFKNGCHFRQRGREQFSIGRGWITRIRSTIFLFCVSFEKCAPPATTDHFLIRIPLNYCLWLEFD